MTEQFDEDRTIDRTLAALGKPTLPHGMHDRLLQRVQQSELQADAALPPHRFLPRPGGWPSMLAVSATAAAVLIATVLLHTSMHRNAPAQNAARVKTPIAFKAGASSVPKLQQESMAKRNVRMAASTYSESLLSAEHHGSSAAMIASIEPSFPPPPMPLTEQEKLLVRLAHHSDAIELAKLNTQALDASFEAQKIQFNDFFYTRPIEENDDNSQQQ